jgi:hypothetical protein
MDIWNNGPEIVVADALLLRVLMTSLASIATVVVVARLNVTKVALLATLGSPVGWKESWNIDALCLVSVAGSMIVGRTYVVHQAGFVKEGHFFEAGDLAIGVRQLMLQLSNCGHREGRHGQGCWFWIWYKLR